MALSKDRGTGGQKIDRKYGLVCEAKSGKIIENFIVGDVSQEHGMVSSLKGDIDFSKYPIGSKLRILPNHACMTAAAHSQYHLLDKNSEEVTYIWQRCTGW